MNMLRKTIAGTALMLAGFASGSACHAASDGSAWNLADVLKQGWVFDTAARAAGGRRRATGMGQAFQTPHILAEPFGFRMYYTGRKDQLWAIGTATSTDLVHWTKYPPSNPAVGKRVGPADRLSLAD